MASKNLLQLRPLFRHAALLKPTPSNLPGCATSFRTVSASSILFNAPVSSESYQKFVQPNTPPKAVPKKETLLTIDWILQGLTPQFMKTRLQPIFEKMDPDLEFVDEIFGYRAKGVSQLGVHITKVRSYFRWKSPYNKTAHKGSYLFEDDKYVVLLWGLETMESSFWTYFPSFITGKETPVRYLEGALHFTVSPEGKITKIVNRKITERDIKLAKEFGDLKISENERFDKEDKKAAEAELKEKIQRHDG
uniref:Uncharacterized protein n=1 Tax=Panagrolaimus superbus TaxID=310955 RepID=A0A914YW74_9BILA